MAYIVVAGTAEPGETGAYDLTIESPSVTLSPPSVTLSAAKGVLAGRLQNALRAKLTE